MGSFPCYGYLRNENNPHKPVPDEFAAETVRKIFRMKASGYSNKKIAEHLNDFGVPSPLEYKRLLNLSYSTGFKLYPLAKWSATAVDRILENETYTGTMVQGKETTASHKVKKRIRVPKNEWIRVENTHEPIISKEDFLLVEKITRADTRISPGNNTLYPLSGLLFCPLCGENMIRKPVKSQGRVYVYYICSTNKTNPELCKNNLRIRENALNGCIFNTLRNFISAFSHKDEISEYERTLPYEKELETLQKLIDTKTKELNKYTKLRASLYEDYKNGILNQEEYLSLKKDYGIICKDIQCALSKTEKHRKNILEKILTDCNREPGDDLPEFSRPLLIILINRITVLSKNRIRIEFSFRNHSE